MHCLVCWQPWPFGVAASAASRAVQYAGPDFFCGIAVHAVTITVAVHWEALDQCLTSSNATAGENCAHVLPGCLWLSLSQAVATGHCGSDGCCMSGLLPVRGVSEIVS